MPTQLLPTTALAPMPAAMAAAVQVTTASAVSAAGGIASRVASVRRAKAAMLPRVRRQRNIWPAHHLTDKPNQIRSKAHRARMARRVNKVKKIAAIAAAVAAVAAVDVAARMRVMVLPRR